MRVAVVGAGAVGCYLAARLSGRGHQLTLVGRADQVKAITSEGLLLREASGTARRYTLRAVEALGEPHDLVLLAVKSQDVAESCTAIHPYLRGAPVVTLQNGVRADQIAADVLGRDRVIGAVVMCAATYVRPGEVSVQFPGWLIVGEPFRELGKRARAIRRLLGGAAPTYMTPRLERVRWSKLISNLNNGLSAATGLLLSEVLHTPAGRVLPARVMREGYAAARAAGIHLDHGLYGLTPDALRRDPNVALIALLQSTMPTLIARVPERLAVAVLVAAGRGRLGKLPIRGSTWQSIARGRLTEIGYLNGEIVTLGKQHGVPTPYNARIVEMVRRAEQTGAFCRVEELLP